MTFIIFWLAMILGVVCLFIVIRTHTVKKILGFFEFLEVVAMVILAIWFVSLIVR